MSVRGVGEERHHQVIVCAHDADALHGRNICKDFVLEQLLAARFQIVECVFVGACKSVFGIDYPATFGIDVVVCDARVHDVPVAVHVGEDIERVTHLAFADGDFFAGFLRACVTRVAVIKIFLGNGGKAISKVAGVRFSVLC